MSAALLAAAVLGGTAATYFLDDEVSAPARLAMGAPLGIVALGHVGFMLGWAFGLGAATAALTGLVVFTVPVLLLLRRGGRRRVGEDIARARAAAIGALRPPTWTAAATAVFYVVMAVLVARLLDRALFEAPEGGGVFTGDDHNLGDLPFHLAIVTSFLYGHNFPPEHPELMGARLTYPFVVDLAAALLMAAGATARQALRLENLALGWALVGLLHRFALRLTRDRLAALLAPVLAMASGGLGFLLLSHDVDPSAGGLVALLRHPTRDYTIMPQGPLRWGNLAVTMLVPQRSFLLGLPLFLIVATLWWQAIGDDDRGRARRRLLAAGIVTGLMPLAHAHAFLTALGVGTALALLFPDARGWARSLLAALVLATPQVLLISSGTAMQAGTFIGLQFGWDRGDEGVLRFWWLNLGLFIPALLVALLWRWPRLVDGRTLRFYLPFTLCFLVPNLVRLSPWIWDNVKFMVWWHLVSAVLVALLLARLLRAGGGARAAAAVLFVLLTLSGALDLWRMASGSILLPVVTPEGTVFADEIRAATPPGAVILHAPTYNSEVYLAGRRSVIGYPGHIWSQGLAAGTREDDVKRLYAGTPYADALLARYGVGYVLVGPRERALEGFDEEALARLPVVVEHGRYALLRVP